MYAIRITHFHDRQQCGASHMQQGNHFNNIHAKLPLRLLGRNSGGRIELVLAELGREENDLHSPVTMRLRCSKEKKAH